MAKKYYIAFLVALVTTAFVMWFAFNKGFESEASNKITEQGTSQEGQAKDVAVMPEVYLSSNYKVVSVVRNPFYPESSRYDSLVVATTRGVYDDSCGGAYHPQDCYFFLESTHTNVESPDYIGEWSGGFPSLDPDSIVFTSPNTVEFRAHAADAGSGVVEVWVFDLTTGESVMTSREQTDSH